MGKSPRKPTAKSTKAAFERLWLSIEEFVQASPSLVLRDAINIIGHHHFGLGWSWTEYRTGRNAARTYEAEAQRVGRLGLPIPVSNDSGTQAALNAADFRRKIYKT
jgi:hypothetical protein